MRVIKEAEVGTTKFSLTPDYFAISGKCEVNGTEFKVVLTPNDTVDLVMWLNNELFAAKPLAVLPGKPQPEKVGTSPKKEETIYEPGERSFAADSATPPLIKSISGGSGSVPMGPEVVTVG